MAQVPGRRPVLRQHKNEFPNLGPETLDFIDWLGHLHPVNLLHRYEGINLACDWREAPVTLANEEHQERLSFNLSLVLVRFDHIACVIVNANHRERLR